MRNSYLIKILLVFVLLSGGTFIDSILSLNFFTPQLLSSNIRLPQDKDFEISFKLGMEYIDGELYEEAINVFKGLLAKDEYNANTNYLLGFCYYNIPAKRSQAIPYFENALNDVGGDYRPGDYTETRSPAIAYYYLADIYFINNEFEEAITNFENLKLLLEYADVNLIKHDKTELLSQIDRRMENCNNGILFSQNPVNIEFDEIPKLNDPEYSCLSGRLINGVWFTKQKISADSKSNSDIFLMTKKNDKWLKAEKLSGDINSSSDDIFCCIAIEGQLLLFSSNRDEDNDYDIYYSKKKGKKWSEPQNNLNINTKSNETFATYSPDGNMILFVSDRPGGQGGKDIYKSDKQSDGSWGQAENLGELINTQYDEESPFLADDGKTLYFSSRAHDNMGGYDIFYSIYDNGIWSSPRNIGFPINTTLDDLYFSKITGNAAIYASGRRDSPGDFYLYPIKSFEQITLASSEAVEEEVAVAGAVAGEEEVAVEEAEPQGLVAVSDEEVTAMPVYSQSRMNYTVQIGAGNMKVKYFNKITEKLVCFSSDGLPRFYAGVFATRDEAAIYRDELVSLGYSDAWTPLIDENRCNDFDLYYLLNLDKKSSSQERSEMFYTVQIGAGNMKISYFNKLKNIRLCEGDDGLTRFIVGEFSSKDEALRVRDEIMKLGYLDAWIPEIDAKRCGN